MRRSRLWNPKRRTYIVALCGLIIAPTGVFAAPAAPAAMPLGAHALPPRGYVAFCERQPGDCGADPKAVEQAALKADREFSDLLAMRDGRFAPPRPADPGALAPVRDAAASASRRLARGALSQVARVNADINHRLTPRSDLATYGADDYWATPLSDGRIYGDCEDFALEKQRALLALGFPRSALNLAEGLTPSGEAHAVLLVATPAGELVLDSLTPEILPWQATPYRWVRREIAGRPFDWAVVRNASVAGARAP